MRIKLTQQLAKLTLGVFGGMVTMNFVSPRFAGDSELEDILNDPDTGLKKLQTKVPPSPPGSVTKVQTTLFDLKWFLEIDPPIYDLATAVDGVYGPTTTSVVLLYKKHYDIHFPPDAPTGSFDGFTGPRTLRKLDRQIVLWDESTDAIDAKRSNLEAAGLTIVADPDVSTPIPQRGTSGVLLIATIGGTSGAMLHQQSTGAFEIHGNIWTAYAQQGFAAGPLGFPTSDEHDDGAGFRRSDFEHGSLRCDLSTGSVELIGNPAPPVLPF